MQEVGSISILALFGGSMFAALLGVSRQFAIKTRADWWKPAFAPQSLWMSIREQPVVLRWKWFGFHGLSHTSNVGHFIRSFLRMITLSLIDLNLNHSHWHWMCQFSGSFPRTNPNRYWVFDNSSFCVYCKYVAVFWDTGTGWWVLKYLFHQQRMARSDIFACSTYTKFVPDQIVLPQGNP